MTIKPTHIVVKVGRKEYLKLKARERRKREREAREAAKP